MSESSNRQMQSAAAPEITTSDGGNEGYRQLRKQQLLQQCNAIKHLNPDVNSRKLRYIANHAIHQAFL